MTYCVCLEKLKKYEVPARFGGHLLAPFSIPIVMQSRILTEKFKAAFTAAYFKYFQICDTSSQAEHLIYFANRYRTGFFVWRMKFQGQWTYIKDTVAMLHPNGNLTLQAELIAKTLQGLYLSSNEADSLRQPALDHIAEHLYPDSLYNIDILKRKVSKIIGSLESDADQSPPPPSPD